MANVLAFLDDYDNIGRQMASLAQAEAQLGQTTQQLAAVRQQVAGATQALQSLTQQELKHETQLNNLEHGTFKFLVPNRHAKEHQKEAQIQQEKAQIAQAQASLAQLQQQEGALRQQEAAQNGAVQQLLALRQRQEAAFLAIVNSARSPALTQIEQKIQQDIQMIQGETVFAQQLEGLLGYYQRALGHFTAALRLEMRAEQSNMTDVVFENSISEYNRDLKMQQARQYSQQASMELANIANALPPRLFQVDPQLANMLRQVPTTNLAANNFMGDILVDQFGRGADLMNDFQTENRLQQNMMAIRQAETMVQTHMRALQQFINNIRGYIQTLNGQIAQGNQAIHAERIRIYESVRASNNRPTPAGIAPPQIIAAVIPNVQPPPQQPGTPQGAPQGQPQPYGAPQGQAPYGAPQAYGAPQGQAPYGAPQGQPYGAPQGRPAAYGAPQQPYGAPQQPYGQNPSGAPPSYNAASSYQK